MARRYDNCMESSRGMVKCCANCSYGENHYCNTPVTACKYWSDIKGTSMHNPDYICNNWEKKNEDT